MELTGGEALQDVGDRSRRASDLHCLGVPFRVRVSEKACSGIVNYGQHRERVLRSGHRPHVFRRVS